MYLPRTIQERRLHARRPLASPVYIERGDTCRAVAFNLSEDGLALHECSSLIQNEILGMRFQLPESRSWVETNGRVAWVNQSRKEAGTTFVDLSETARSDIRAWILLGSSPKHSGSEVRVLDKDQKVAEPIGPVSIRDIRLDEALSGIAHKWHECQSRFPAHTIHGNPDWIQEHFKHEKDRVHIFLLESGGVVIGAVPAVLDLELTCNLGEFTVKKLPMRIMRLLDCSCMPAKESVYDILFEQIVRSRVEARARVST